jgi:hypothetical protein
MKGRRFIMIFLPVTHSSSIFLFLELFIDSTCKIHTPTKVIVHKATPITGMITVDTAMTAIHFFFMYPRSSTNIQSHPTRNIKKLKDNFCRQDSLQLALHVVHLPMYPPYFLQNFIMVPSPQFSQGPKDSSGININPFLYVIRSLFSVILRKLPTPNNQKL